MGSAFRVYAHRGASTEAPENTLEAFRRGLDLGADGLELDVHLTRDGALVVSHDADGGRLAGVPRRICDCSLAEVRGWDLGARFVARDGSRPFAGRAVRVATFEEVLVEFAGIPLNVDLKPREPDPVEPALALIRKLRAHAQVRLASFHSAVLRRVRRLGYAGPTGLGREEVAAVLALPSVVIEGFGWRGRAAQVPLRTGPVRFDRRGFVERCQRAGLRVDFWTVNAPQEALGLRALGADGVMTDDPATIVPAVRAAAARRSADRLAPG